MKCCNSEILRYVNVTDVQLLHPDLVEGTVDLRWFTNVYKLKPMNMKRCNIYVITLLLYNSLLVRVMEM